MKTTRPSGRAERLRQVARAEHAERLLERALAMGVVSSEQVDSARRLIEDSNTSALLDKLIEQGAISPEARGQLENEEATDLFGALSQPRSALPAEALAHAADSDRNLGELILVEQLGRGGTGAVWKAWDRRLGRWVAVKIASATLESAIARDRFSREALATARMSHPNIVPVFQVGNERGRAYLVMPLIEGQTLSGYNPPPERALEILRDVARAVEYAHERGIVHRDIKPGNLMLDGAGRAMVLDFGLAYLREETSSRLTQAGEVLGTASFMAPEQARGGLGTPGPAIDVYGLGATLFALCCGRAPFIGDSLPAVIAQVTNEEPPRPRRLRPELDPRIEAIITKAMDRDPGARYSSAAALADDIDRVLRGEPVGAGHRGLIGRGLRQIRRRSVILGAAVLLIGALTTAFVARQRDQRAKYEAMSALRDVGKLALDTALQLRRTGDTTGMRRFLPQLISAYRNLGDDKPVFAEAEYLMGRTYRALLDEEPALRHQQRALRVDPDYAPALYERAVLLSNRYGTLREQVVWSMRTEGWSQQTPGEEVERMRPALANLRVQILADCARLEKIAPGEVFTDAARGILAFHRRHFADARARLERVVKADPTREEAWETLASTEAAAGNAELAEAILDRALSHDRGYAPFQVARCTVTRQKQPEKAASAAAAALVLDPGSIGARLCGGGASVEFSHQRMHGGHDPAEWFSRAEKFLDPAAGQNVAAALTTRGVLSRYRGLMRVRRDADPVPEFTRSIADFARAIALDGSLAEGWWGRGRTRWYLALHRIDHGEEGESALRDAEIDFDEGARRASALATAFLWRGEINGLRGRLRVSNGAAAEPFFARAEGDFKLAMARVDDGWSRLVRGNVRSWHGTAVARAGGDASALWSAAREDLSIALATLPPVFPDAYVRRGLLGAHMASPAGPGAAPPGAQTAILRAALADLNVVLERDPDHVDALLGRTRVRELMGDQRGAGADRDRASRLQPQRARTILAGNPPLPW